MPGVTVRRHTLGRGSRLWHKRVGLTSPLVSRDYAPCTHLMSPKVCKSPYSAHPASALPKNVRVPTGLRHCDGSAGTARDSEKPVGRIGVDHGVARQIPLWPPHPPLL